MSNERQVQAVRAKIEELTRPGGFGPDYVAREILALLAPEEDNSGVEKAVEAGARFLFGAFSWQAREGHADWERLTPEVQDQWRENATNFLASVRPTLTQQPVLLSDEERLAEVREELEKRARICERSCEKGAAKNPPCRRAEAQALRAAISFIDQTDQHHVPTKGQGERC